jgi:hypothetical protein
MRRGLPRPVLGSRIRVANVAAYINKHCRRAQRAALSATTTPGESRNPDPWYRSGGHLSHPNATGGARSWLVGTSIGGDRSDSQADSVSSILVTRTSPEGPGQDLSPEPRPRSILGRFRAAVPLASGHQDPCRRHHRRPGRLGLDVGVDGARNPLVRTARLVLVDQRRAFAVMSHPRHQVLQARAAGPGNCGHIRSRRDRKPATGALRCPEASGPSIN